MGGVVGGVIEDKSYGLFAVTFQQLFVDTSDYEIFSIPRGSLQKKILTRKSR
jgi:hypothetical protein